MIRDPIVLGPCEVPNEVAHYVRSMTGEDFSLCDQKAKKIRLSSQILLMGGYIPSNLRIFHKAYIFLKVHDTSWGQLFNT